MSVNGSQDEDDHDESNAGPSRKKHKNAHIYNNNNSCDEQMSQNEGASSGILQCVTVKNFMCHDHMIFRFSQNINFVQGRNGSGKSAILTAVVVGLGGSTRVTNRGSSLKELVKYGKQTATIEISIKNCGRDAFKHDLYGDLIVVERKILATGGGGYKIKGKNGAIVSMKKDDIQRMLDHFNMQVDNPITILNQDMSRAFLNSTDPHELYKFFLKATQLQQMKDDYSQLEKALKISSDIIQNRKEFLPLLKKDVDELRTQYEFCVTLNDKRKKLTELRHELVWAMIIRAEKAVENAEKEVEVLERNMAKIQEKIVNFEEKYKEEQQLHNESQETLNTITNLLMPHSKKVKEHNEALIKAKKLHKDKQSQVITADRKVKGIQKEISVLKEAIKKDNDVAQTQWATQHALWLEKMKAIEHEMEELEQNMRTEETHHVNLQNTVDVKNSDLMQVVLEEKATRKRCYAIEHELQGLKGQQSNQFTVYGRWVPQVLAEIDMAHKRGAFTKKPVGPLGSFIKVCDRQWGHIAEMVLGNRISGFCVDNRNDEKTLRKIMNKVDFGRQSQPIVIVSRFREQVHDVSKYEVQSDNYRSLWSMLMISDTVVANTLIDQCQVESILLIPTAQEAGRILKNQTTVPRNCKVAYTLNRDIYYPDPNYRLYSGRGQEPARFLQVSLEEKVRDLTGDLENSREEVRRLNHEIQLSRADIHSVEESVQESTRKLRCYKKKMDHLRLQLADLQTQEEQPPPDVSQMEEDIKQQNVMLIEAEDNLKRFKEEAESSKNSFMQISLSFEELKKKEKSLFQDAENIQEKLSQFEASINKILHTLEVYKKKKKELQKNKSLAETKHKKASENLKKELQGAGEFQPRKDTARSVEEVQRQYAGLEARLNKERAQSGDPLVVAEKYRETKRRFAAVSAEVESHYNLISKIKTSLQLRLKRFRRFRKLLSIMIKTNFRTSLSIRKLQGCLNFDFEKHTLTLSIVKMDNEKDSNAISVINRGSENRKQFPQQTLAMMSGGERSFATVSFIIALWDVMESPIRILDEFDVFMDIVARRQSLTLMIKAAKPNTQYIYLTPLELDTTAHPNVNIFKMPDPKRKAAEKDTDSEV